MAWAGLETLLLVSCSKRLGVGCSPPGGVWVVVCVASSLVSWMCAGSSLGAGEMSLVPTALSSFCSRLGRAASTAESYQVCTPSAW